MERHRLRRLGYVIADQLPPHQPGADDYLPDGTPVFRSVARANAFFARLAELGGPRFRANPDGGTLSPREVREGLEKHRSQQDDLRRERARKRAQRAAQRRPRFHL